MPARIADVAGWTVRPEVSFANYGERGVVDLLAWHAGSRALLVVELKTEIVDIGELLGTLDRKRRLAPAIATTVGWRPASISTWLVVGDGMTNRRRITAHLGTFRAVLPDGQRHLHRWLLRPIGVISALTFVPDRRPGNARSGYSTSRRVRRPCRAVGRSPEPGATAS